ncbi:zinc metalloproteinase-disintegrin-like VLAIP-A [Bombina bombina]|uniref:zinc metalloproteinase-disintegrin-like VLAIP-A n=1 Tax=Bombina bombina TaxID=8345 RepID=UPI00235AA119|nr:zinc metalloproteinase-disintegrin-like VLAIP-A [Bombina bombina]
MGIKTGMFTVAIVDSEETFYIYNDNAEICAASCWTTEPPGFRDLVSDSYSETHYLPNGAPITIISDNKDHCYYQGHVKDDNDSLVSVSVCSGISGVILTQGLRILIDPLKNTDHEEHVVYLDQEETPRVCGVTNNIWTEDELLKSQTINDSEKQELFTSQKYVQLYIVADKSMFTKYNSTEAVKKKIFEIVNYVNMVYKSINTFVALIGFEIWDANNQIEVHTSASITLDRFYKWRKNNLLPRKLHDNAQLLTNTDFEGPTVGMAYIGTMCSDLSTGIIQDHSKISTSVGATLAHEMGHNLGMNHDDSSCGCSATSCIMSPTITYTTPSLFSACSLQYFNQFIRSKLPKCLLDKPQPNDIQASPVCGNKFTEIGEDCDCGTKEECTNECCDAATCKLKPDAKCAEGECCVNCQVVKAGVVCRPSKDDCDLPDMCDGNSPVCQTDHLQVNGFPCSNGKGYCYNGKCPNMLSQCVTLWGQSESHLL